MSFVYNLFSLIVSQWVIILIEFDIWLNFEQITKINKNNYISRWSIVWVLGKWSGIAQKFAHSTFCSFANFIQFQKSTAPFSVPRIVSRQSLFPGCLFVRFPHCSELWTFSFSLSFASIALPVLWIGSHSIYPRVSSDLTIQSTLLLEKLTWICLTTFYPYFPFKRKWLITKSSEVFSCCWSSTVISMCLTLSFLPWSGQYCSDCLYR